ncbi:hypothetical protein Desde_3149 [Desulfitobacterium dehalogenans ATCC 51507]|uniref:Uncharacterized protein n=1 Tax=Desulfitobacterium dehalogenans (strain ATCC 51507 / DSM 9161 / JW/IU-DC1) TaxID=756499 RepID=I4ABV6_DESDJ|nr:hypothetical protein [Desulfitobacterium dehalogenans]AFM01441.1 hypothetical protein Desde_3149 [Desulfitobacterium dehalogenans ATCC 51507]
MSRNVSRKTIIELFIYSFILVISIILLIQDKHEPMSVNIKPDFTLQEEKQSDAIVPNE